MKERGPNQAKAPERSEPTNKTADRARRISSQKEYLLEVMAHVVAQGYLPELASRPSGYPDPRGLTERILRKQIEKSARIVYSKKE